ncbi:hypothetical protein [Microbacterium sp. Leaf179]|uniref:hypothetical protein n=1 Tax=Microbacterium sp. Leaf179 TaxID=1736288 RepID=UPI0006F9BFC3|nr:hypothetical protein [Microbacterium sp. Leaf179]KQR86745.1 hypothetical protein ASF96_10515 [Microbacterium sp. Leaf179]
MTAFEDARDRLPEEATITRDLYDFLIRQSGGNENPSVAPSTLARKMVSVVQTLEERIIRIEEGLSSEDDGGWEFTEEPSEFSSPRGSRSDESEEELPPV